jgi:hypothetical protein
MDFWRQFPFRLRAAHTDATPFMAAILLPTQQSANIVDVTAFPGLVLMHVAVDPAEPQLITYWRSREDFERSGTALLEQVGGRVLTARHVAEYREQCKRFLKNVPWQAFVGMVLALIGGVDAVRLLYNRVHMQPDLLLSQRAGDINYLTDDTIDEPLAITNRIPVEQHVDVLGAALRKGGVTLKVPVTVNPSTIRDLPENQSEQVRFRTIASTPGAYSILVHLRERAGWFAAQLKDFPINLVVWSSQPRADVVHISRRDAMACQFEGDLLVGAAAPDGLTCRIRIAHHPELTRVYVTGLNSTTVSGSEWRVHGENVAAVGSALFKIPTIAGYKRRRFHVELESAARANWDHVLANTEIFFDTPTKEAPCAAPQS